MSYELKEEDILLFASKVHADTEKKGDELRFKHCPYCEGGHNGDKWTFSVNVKSGAFNCLRTSCGKQGHFVELARDFDISLDDGYKKKYRTLPVVNYQDEFRIAKAVQYMQTRGISETVTRRYKLTVRKDNTDILVIPFYDENNDLQFVKYRNTKFKKGITKGSKEYSETNCKPILFGMAQCQDYSRLVITEGQIDSLSLTEAGIKNAVSVPTGALGFTWLEYCFEWLLKFAEIIIMGDYENGEISLVERLQKKFPKPLKVVRKIDYLGEKDANDILLKYGKEALVKAIDNAELVPVKAVKELSEVEDVDLSLLPKISTGFKDLDKALGGFYFGQVILVTGKRGEGKSTLCSQFCCEAIDKGYNSFIYSGELPNYHFKRWFDGQLAGIQNLLEFSNGDYKRYDFKEGIRNKITESYRHKAFIFDNTAIEDENIQLLATVEKAICQYQIKFVLIDNLMTALDCDDSNGLNLAQGNFVKQLKNLAVKYNVVIMLVAHPKKGDLNSNDSVSGSSDITNRVDVNIVYKRTEQGGTIEVYKNRLTGKLLTDKTAIKVCYDEASKRIFPEYSTSNWKYSWETAEIDNGLEDFEIEDLPF